MKASFATLLVGVLFASQAAAQTAPPPLAINTPEKAVACEPTPVSWSGGTPPYSLVVLSGDKVDASPLEDLGKQDGSSTTWIPKLAPGTSVSLKLQDSQGAHTQTPPFAILAGADKSCFDPTTADQKTQANQKTQADQKTQEGQKTRAKQLR